MYELSVFPTQIFNIRTSSPQEYLIFYSELILANIVILSSIMLIVNSIVNSCAFFIMSSRLGRLVNHSLRSRLLTRVS